MCVLLETLPLASFLKGNQLPLYGSKCGGNFLLQRVEI